MLCFSLPILLPQKFPARSSKPVFLLALSFQRLKAFSLATSLRDRSEDQTHFILIFARFATKLTGLCHLEKFENCFEIADYYYVTYLDFSQISLHEIGRLP